MLTCRSSNRKYPKINALISNRAAAAMPDHVHRKSDFTLRWSSASLLLSCSMRAFSSPTDDYVCIINSMSQPVCTDSG